MNKVTQDCMEPELPPQIAEPCPKSWKEMRGDAKRRFCEHCNLHVHNLSEMTASERKELLVSKGRVCVAYETNANGALVTRENTQGLLTFFVRLPWAFLALIASILPFSFSSCTSRRTLGGMLPPSSPSNESQTNKIDAHDARHPIVRGRVAPSPTPQNNDEKKKTDPKVMITGMINWRDYKPKKD